MRKIILSVDRSDANMVSGPYGKSVAIATCPAIEEYFDPAALSRNTKGKLDLLKSHSRGDDFIHHCVITPSLHRLPERSYAAYEMTGDPYAIAASLPKEDLMSLCEVSILLRAHFEDNPSFLVIDKYEPSNHHSYFFVAGRNGPVWVSATWDDFSGAVADWKTPQWYLSVQSVTDKIKYNTPPYSMGAVKRWGQYIFRNGRSAP